MALRNFILVWVLLLSTHLAKSQNEAFEALSDADALVAQQEYLAAYSYYERALPYFQTQEDWYQLSHIYLMMGEGAYEKGNYSNALDLTLKSQETAEKLPLVDTLSFYSLIHQNLGVFYSALGDFENQLKHYEISFSKALEYHGKESEQAADAYFSLGVAYGRRGDWNACIQFTDTSLQISKAIEYKGGISSAYLNLAHAFAVKEDFASAIDYQLRALEFSENAGERARGYNNLGMYYNDLGQLDLALDYLGRSLEMRNELYPKGHDNVLSSLLNFARVHYDAGNLEESAQFIDEAIENGLQAPEENQGYLKIAYNYKAISLFRQGSLSEAATFHEKAKGVDGRRLKVDANVALVGSTIRLGLGEYENALNEIQAALASNVNDFDPQHYYDNPDWRKIEDIGMGIDLLEKKAEILFEKGKNDQSNADLEVALVVYEILDALIEKSRNTYLSKSSKELMSANTHKLYTGAIDLLHTMYQRTADPVYFDRALAYSEKNKSLSLAEKLNDLYAKSFANIPAKTVKEERQLLQEIEFYSNQILNYKGYVEEEIINKWEKIAFEKKEKRKSLLFRIERDYPEYYDLRYNLEMPSYKDIQTKLLEEDEVLMEYFVGDNALFIFVISDQRQEFVKIETEETIKELVEGFRASLIAQEATFYAYSHQLFSTIFQPLESVVKGKKLFIVPDGVLGYVPFEALISSPVESATNPDHRTIAYLIREYPIRYYFSAQSAILNLERETKPKRNGMLALAPVFEQTGQLAAASSEDLERIGTEGQLVPLQGTKEELEKLKQYFSGNFLDGPPASESAFKYLAKNYNLLHIATHTLLDDRFPGLSKMVFSDEGGAKEDGLLHAYELYNMQLNAELVTLSSCNTGFGKLRQGEGIASMASAFAYAGCPNMVMSLWQVKDQTTPEIMDRFYANLSNGIDKDEALQAAKIDYIDNYKRLYSHPYFWASFIYLGDAEPLLQTSNNNNWALYIAAGIPFLLFLLLGWRRKQNA